MEHTEVPTVQHQPNSRSANVLTNLYTPETIRKIIIKITKISNLYLLDGYAGLTLRTISIKNGLKLGYHTDLSQLSGHMRVSISIKSHSKSDNVGITPRIFAACQHVRDLSSVSALWVMRVSLTYYRNMFLGRHLNLYSLGGDRGGISMSNMAKWGVTAIHPLDVIDFLLLVGLDRMYQGEVAQRSESKITPGLLFSFTVGSTD
jgi:hypothetical protein